MATKLQKHEMQTFLEKYGRVMFERDDINWMRVILVPQASGFTKTYRASRKMKYIAMKDVRSYIESDLRQMVKLIEEGC